MADPSDQVKKIQAELTRLGIARNHIYTVRIGEAYIALYAADVLIDAWDNLKQVLDYLTAQM